MPPTRTSAPLLSPTTFWNSASSRYVLRNKKRFSPIRKTPAAKIKSVATMNMPNRNARDIGHRLRASVQELHDKLVFAGLQVLEGSLDHNLSIAHQRQAIRDRPCARQVVRDNDRYVDSKDAEGREPHVDRCHARPAERTDDL